jgi:hypothetical protein
MPMGVLAPRSAHARPCPRMTINMAKFTLQLVTMEPPDATWLMLQRATANAKKHGINLVPGRLNPASGDCAFESAIFNINDRECFHQKYPLSVDYYRRIWMTDMQAKTLDNPTWNLGYTSTEIWQGFEDMKEPGIYERGLFGDLMLPAISVGIHKNILVFNTNMNTPHDPISVISPANFGGYLDSEIPIILAYNLVHFESMHPITEDDVTATMDLAQSYLEGSYSFTRSDSKDLINLDNSNEGKDSAKRDENSFQFLTSGKKITIIMDEDGYMECPICLKRFQRLRPHLKTKKLCSSLIDFEAFNEGFEKFDSNLKKAKEREKKAEIRKRHIESEDLEEVKKRKVKEAERKKELREIQRINKKKDMDHKLEENVKDEAAKKNETKRKNAERKKKERAKCSLDDKKAQAEKDAQQKKIMRENLTPEEKSKQKRKINENNNEKRENPRLKGVAQRFTLDQPYFHDIIESCEGSLKVWSKGEKLEHDLFWQKITANRYTKRLREAYNADIFTENTKGFLQYVLEPKSQGYEANEWTEFLTSFGKIHRKYWTDEIYTVITNPKNVAASNNEKGEFHQANL